VRLDLLPTAASRTRWCASACSINASRTRRPCGRAPIWSILSTLGIRVGIVGWPLSDPVLPVEGYLVSHRAHRAGGLPLTLETRT